MGTWGSIKNFLFGGDATEGMPTRPENADFMGNYIRTQLGGVQDRNAPMAQAAQLGPAAQLNPLDHLAARGQQQSLSDRLNSIASGTAKGAGEMAVDRQVGQAQAAQQAAAQMARGTNTALAMRNAARNTADIGLAGAGEAKMAAMNDQTQANQLLGGVLGQMRGQDIDVAGQNAGFQQQRMLQQGGFQQQTNLANQQSQLAQTGMNDQASLGYLAQLLGVDQATLQADLAARQMKMGDKGIFPTLLQVGGQIGAAAATGGFSGAKPK